MAGVPTFPALREVGRTSIRSPGALGAFTRSPPEFQLAPAVTAGLIDVLPPRHEATLNRKQGSSRNLLGGSEQHVPPVAQGAANIHFLEPLRVKAVCPRRGHLACNCFLQRQSHLLALVLEGLDRGG